MGSFSQTLFFGEVKRQPEIRLRSQAISLRAGAIIRDGDRKRGFHASPCVVPKNLFLEKLAPPFTS